MEPSIHFLYSSTQLALLVLVIVGTAFGTFHYRRFALQSGIIAKVNFRSLHQTIVSRGGGVIFGCVFSFVIFGIWAFGGLPFWLMLCFGVGGVAAVVVGFADDVHEIRAIKKLFAQFCLASWIFLSFYEPLYALHLRDFKGIPPILFSLILVFVPIWFINLYNFIDGIDGMAISGAVFVCVGAVIILATTGGDKNLIFIFALLGASSLGFLFFNLPPASVFMGDAGSIFLGYCLSALLLTTILSGQISVWTWISFLSYFIGDTMVTGIYRLLFVKKWYGVHRSHAYQNLARVYGHAKVTYGVVLYNTLWALPLAIWSACTPSMKYVAALLSLVPVVIWTLRFGPRLSSQ